MKVVVVNYGMGNIYSIQSALNFLGVDNEYSDKAEKILNADKIILPGVGSYSRAMRNLRSSDLDKTIIEAVIEKKKPILGICLGMQLLGISSTEDGYTEGLGFFNGIVEKFDFRNSNLKVPHVGFNDVIPPLKTILFKKLEGNLDFYFVHSYRMTTDIIEGVSYCNYGKRFVGSFEYGHIFGTQFHPEKSQTNGLQVLKNFLGF